MSSSTVHSLSAVNQYACVFLSVDPQWLPDGGWTEADLAAGGCTAPAGSRTACATEISQLKPLTCLSVNRAKFAVELVSSASIPQPILCSEIKKNGFIFHAVQ
jgi:hypothetical protein